MSGFRGQSGIHHVRQPEGSELCFAAIVSSVTGGEPVEPIHQALVESGISEADGSTGVPADTEEVALLDGSLLELEPFMGLSTERLMQSIHERFEAGKAVALLHKKNDDPADTQHHWSLLTGCYEQDGQVVLIGLMDPMRTHREVTEPETLEAMIERTVDFNGGAFACALSVSQPA